MEEKERRHLRIADVCAELSISRSTFYDWRAARNRRPVASSCRTATSGFEGGPGAVAEEQGGHHGVTLEHPIELTDDVRI